jgi:hemoglobin
VTIIEPTRARPATTDISDRADIEDLVRAFYRDAATDDLLGPIFEAAGVDWPAHIATLTDFWAWQLLGERGYDGNPLRAHAPIHARRPFTSAHFERWLDLFTATVDSRYTGPVAAAAKQRATKMANALERLLDNHHGASACPITPHLTSRPETPRTRASQP